MTTCAHCGEAFMPNDRGRPRRFCSVKCSRAAKRADQRAQEPAKKPEPADPLAAKRERLVRLMTERLGREPLRRDVDSLPEVVLDELITHYAGSPGFVW